MMIFFGILLLMVSIYRLVKGNFAHKLMLQAIEHGETNKLTEKEQGILGLKLLGYVGFSATYITTYLLFLINSLKIDENIYPTAIMIAWFVVSFGYGLILNARLKENKEMKIKRFKKQRTFWGTLGDLVTMIYLIYILGLIIF